VAAVAAAAGRLRVGDRVTLRAGGAQSKCAGHLQPREVGLVEEVSSRAESAAVVLFVGGRCD
jgi:hypothetical protein